MKVDAAAQGVPPERTPPTPASCSAEMHRGERLRMPLVKDRAKWLEQLCARGVQGEVAHLGCADSPYTEELLHAGMLLHARLVRSAPPSGASVTGFDLDEGALELLRREMPDARFVLADVAADVPESECGRYALVLAGEVLEHVPDARSFLRGCGLLLASEGRLCLTVPNACCPKVGMRALAGRESVHPDHRVYYSPRTLTRTLAEADYEVQFLASCFAPISGRAGRTVVNPLLRLGHRLFQGPVGDGLIAVARARSNAASIAS